MICYSDSWKFKNWKLKIWKLKIWLLNTFYNNTQGPKNRQIYHFVQSTLLKPQLIIKKNRMRRAPLLMLAVSLCADWSAGKPPMNGECCGIDIDNLVGPNHRSALSLCTWVKVRWRYGAYPGKGNARCLWFCEMRTSLPVNILQLNTIGPKHVHRFRQTVSC